MYNSTCKETINSFDYIGSVMIYYDDKNYSCKLLNVSKFIHIIKITHVLYYPFTKFNIIYIYIYLKATFAN